MLGCRGNNMKTNLAVLSDEVVSGILNLAIGSRSGQRTLLQRKGSSGLLW